MLENSELGRIKNAITKLERQNRRMRWGFCILLALWLATLSASALMRDATAEMKSNAGPEDSVLRVRGLVVVDENGTERVQIGAPLPNPISLGKRTKRRGELSGILLLDDEGNERTGYVTSNFGEVFLTLDNVGEQAAMFYANPHTGSQLIVRDSDNGNFIELNATGKNPTIKILQKGKTLFQAPVAASDK